jgi:hypothetical protein
MLVVDLGRSRSTPYKGVDAQPTLAMARKLRLSFLRYTRDEAGHGV